MESGFTEGKMAKNDKFASCIKQPHKYPQHIAQRYAIYNIKKTTDMVNNSKRL